MARLPAVDQHHLVRAVVKGDSAGHARQRAGPDRVDATVPQAELTQDVPIDDVQIAIAPACDRPVARGQFKGCGCRAGAPVENLDVRPGPARSGRARDPRPRQHRYRMELNILHRGEGVEPEDVVCRMGAVCEVEGARVMDRGFLARDGAGRQGEQGQDEVDAVEETEGGVAPVVEVVELPVGALLHLAAAGAEIADPEPHLGLRQVEGGLGDQRTAVRWVAQRHLGRRAGVVDVPQGAGVAAGALEHTRVVLLGAEASVADIDQRAQVQQGPQLGRAGAFAVHDAVLAHDEPARSALVEPRLHTIEPAGAAGAVLGVGVHQFAHLADLLGDELVVRVLRPVARPAHHRRPAVVGDEAHAVDRRGGDAVHRAVAGKARAVGRLWPQPNGPLLVEVGQAGAEDVAVVGRVGGGGQPRRERQRAQSERSDSCVLAHGVVSFSFVPGRAAVSVRCLRRSRSPRVLH